MRNDNAVAVAVQEEVHHDCLHPCAPGHVGIGFDVDRSGELVDDPRVSLRPIGHQVDRDGSDQLRNSPAGSDHFRVPVEPCIPGDTESVISLAGDQPCDL